MYLSGIRDTNDLWTGILTIALAAELKQLEGVLVVINSATKNAADPSALQWRILTTADDASKLIAKVKERLKLPELKIQAVNFEPWYPRVGKLLGGKSSARKAGHQAAASSTDRIGGARADSTGAAHRCR
eukprot:Skav230829  [mRNA]  locus=scaffold2865:1404:5957:- [translate_table: standard]